jgi:hypothetical protein
MLYFKNAWISTSNQHYTSSTVVWNIDLGLVMHRQDISKGFLANIKNWIGQLNWNVNQWSICHSPVAHLLNSLYSLFFSHYVKILWLE